MSASTTSSSASAPAVTAGPPSSLPSSSSSSSSSNPSSTAAEAAAPRSSKPGRKKNAALPQKSIYDVPEPKVGMRMRVNFDEKWVGGDIMDVTHGQVYVHYDDGGEGWADYPDRGIMIVQGDNLWSCSECGYATKAKPQLENHVIIVHKGEILNSSQMKAHISRQHEKSEGDFVCETCHKRFHSRAYLTVHVKGVHEKAREYVCEKCGKAYAGLMALKTHMMAKHGTGDPVKDLPHDCTVETCDKPFKSPVELRRHQKVCAWRRCLQCHKPAALAWVGKRFKKGSEEALELEKWAKRADKPTEDLESACACPQRWTHPSCACEVKQCSLCKE